MKVVMTDLDRKPTFDEQFKKGKSLENGLEGSVSIAKKEDKPYAKEDTPGEGEDTFPRYTYRYGGYEFDD